MIGEPPVPLPSVCAGLFFRGVLPAFEDYLKFDQGAQKILGSMEGEVWFTNRDGLSACLRFENGKAFWSEVPEGKPKAHLDLGSEANTVRFIRGGVAIPRLKGGFLRPVFLSKLLRLFLRFQKYLKPPAKALQDPEFRTLHVRLALAVALFSLAEIGREDAWARKMLESCPNGTINFRVEGEDLTASIEKAPGGLYPRRGADACLEADAEVIFASSKVAMEILTQKSDSHAAVALGGIRVEGLVPLADGINHVLDRVARYLPS
tara:strand:- start:15635 stop:16423 length:789 start_codon:yes stop_codon:yes gene_type:complete